MHEITLTPEAAVCLFVAHQKADIKGAAAIRASYDTERFFLESDPLVKDAVDADGKRIPGIQAAFSDARTVRAEKHVFERLKGALEACSEDPKFTGYEPGKVAPKFLVAALDAVAAAKEVQVAKDAPRVVEGGKKAKGA